MNRKVDDLGRIVIPIEWRREIGLGEPGTEAVIRKTADGRGVEIRAAKPAGEARFTPAEVLEIVERAAAGVVPGKQTALGAAVMSEIRRVAPETDNQV